MRVHYWGFTGSGKEFTCPRSRCRRHRLDPWVGQVPWSRKWQPIPVFSSGESQGLRSLAGYSPWGHRESVTMERVRKHARLPSAVCAVYISTHRSVAMSLWSADNQYPPFVSEDNGAWRDRVTCPCHRAEVTGRGRFVGSCPCGVSTCCARGLFCAVFGKHSDGARAAVVERPPPVTRSWL